MFVWDGMGWDERDERDGKMRRDGVDVDVFCVG